MTPLEHATQTIMERHNTTMPAARETARLVLVEYLKDCLESKEKTAQVADAMWREEVWTKLTMTRAAFKALIDGVV